MGSFKHLNLDFFPPWESDSGYIRKFGGTLRRKLLHLRDPSDVKRSMKQKEWGIRVTTIGIFKLLLIKLLIGEPGWHSWVSL